MEIASKWRKERGGVKGGRAHLWHPLWRDERSGFDCPQASTCQTLNQLDLGLEGDGHLLILQAIARSDLDELDAVVKRGPLLGCRCKRPGTAYAWLEAREAA